MKKLLLLVMVSLMSIISYAHQPNLSTSLLSVTKEGKYILQVTSSLAAFEGEIEFIYSKESYKTPEEFKELVKKHFNKNVSFIVNETDTLMFVNPVVILGHETKLVAEVLNIPETVNSFYFKNSMFKDMPRNKMAIMMLTDKFPRNQMNLENENHHILNLKLVDKNWENRMIALEKNSSLNFWINSNEGITYLMIFLAVIVFIIFFWKREK